ncbi:hypothetical protein ACFSHQ_17275 [Gemmobacter lanyuensis]
MVPWQAIGDLVLVATTRPEDFLRQRPALEALFGRVSPVLTTPTALETAVLAARGPALDRAALLRVPEGESCRNWGQPHHQFWVRAALALTLALTLAAPMLMLWAVTLWCLITLALATAMKGPRSLPPCAAPRLKDRRFWPIACPASRSWSRFIKRGISRRGW